MTEVPAHEVLRRLFDVVVAEARINEAFARKLMESVGDAVAAEIATPAAPRRKTPASAEFHAINVLRSFGEPALRGKLEQVRATGGLRAIASASGLVLSGSASKPKASRAELIDGIITAAKHYDAQRATAVALVSAVSAT
jgi:hypothetical protein